MTPETRRHLVRFILNAPASPDHCEQALRSLLAPWVPHDYIEFLCEIGNGGQGFIGDGASLILWPVERLLSLNEAYKADTRAPQCVVFGSDGGGESFAFDGGTTPGRIVSLLFVGMSRMEAVGVASSFSEFIEKLSVPLAPDPDPGA